MCVPLHNVESAPRTFPWHGSTTMFNHLPFANLLDKLAECAAGRKKCVLECAVHESAGKHVCGEVFICTSRSDREALVHHHAISLTKPPQTLTTDPYQRSRFVSLCFWLQAALGLAVLSKQSSAPVSGKVACIVPKQESDQANFNRSFLLLRQETNRSMRMTE